MSQDTKEKHVITAGYKLYQLSTIDSFCAIYHQNFELQFNSVSQDDQFSDDVPIVL